LIARAGHVGHFRRVPAEFPHAGIAGTGKPRSCRGTAASIDRISLGTVFHKMELCVPFLGICDILRLMIVIGTDLVEVYFKSKAGHRGIKAARAQYDAWLAIAETAEWRTPEEVKQSHPKASILKGGRVVFNIKANDFRLVSLVQYIEGVLMIRFFGSHEEYDKIDAETV
jgi:mRNA interferase HigB